MDIGIILMLIIGIFLAQIVIIIFVVRYLKKKGTFLRDEMTREMMRKSNEIAFWGSWLFWILILILASISEFTVNWYIYSGLISMGVIYVITNAIIQYKLKKKGQD